MRALAAVVALLLVTSVAASADRAFLTPALPAARPADAVLLLGGDGDRLQVVRRLVAEGYSHEVVASIYGYRPVCPGVPGAVVTCFTPRPLSTQGEARAFARIAASHHWRSVIVVSGHAQARRGRSRVQRCFAGRVDVVPARAAASDWMRLHDVAYEAFATVKANLWQRGC